MKSVLVKRLVAEGLSASSMLSRDAWSEDAARAAKRHDSECRAAAARLYELKVAKALAQIDLASEAYAELEVADVARLEAKLLERAKLTYPFLLDVYARSFKAGCKRAHSHPDEGCEPPPSQQ